MNKKLNEAAVANELKGQSLFFAPQESQELPPPTKQVPPSTAPSRVPPPAILATAMEPSEPRPAAPQPIGIPMLAFDITEVPYRRDTFLLTDDEWEAFDELKLTLRRQLDVKVTKNDLARCAIAYVIEDCRRRGANSPVIAPLKQRNSR